MIENWFDLQHFPVGEAVTVRWGPMVGGSANDVINFEILDRLDGDNRVFETGVHLFGDPEPISPDGTDTSITIPAGTLQVDGEYDFILGFNKIDTFDNGQTLADALFASIPYAETFGDLRPVTRHPSTVIDWGVVGRWTRYDQIGADTLNPRADDEFAAVQAIITPGSLGDLSYAEVNFQHSLESVADQGQWIFAQPAYSAQEVEAMLPNGDINLSWSFSAGGSHSTSLRLEGGSMSPVRISNWANLQSFDATKVGSIHWEVLEFWRDFDAFILTIEDENENVVFETPIDLDSAGMLRGDDRSLDLPANTLEAASSTAPGSSSFRSRISMKTHRTGHFLWRRMQLRPVSPSIPGPLSVIRSRLARWVGRSTIFRTVRVRRCSISTTTSNSGRWPSSSGIRSMNWLRPRSGCPEERFSPWSMMARTMSSGPSRLWPALINWWQPFPPVTTP